MHHRKSTSLYFSRCLVCLSSADQLSLVYSEVSARVDSSRIVHLVLFDFSKIFDVVPYVLLLQKLRALGLSESLLNWIWEVITNRSMYEC